MELLLAGICVFLAAASNYIFFVFALHIKLPNLPGSDFYLSSTQAIVKKYPIYTYPAKLLVAIAWPGILLLNLAAAVFLFVAVLKGRSYFTKKAYVCWIIQMIGTIVWTYTFDREQHVGSLLTLIAVFCSFLACLCLALASNFSQKSSNHAPESSSWWFRKIVMSYFGVVGSWILVTLAATTNYAVAYKDSAEFSLAQVRGYCSLDVCGVLSLFWVAIPQILWTFIDLHFSPHYTVLITSFYPSLSFFMFGIFLSNYKSNFGLSYTNWVTLIISMTALFASIYRSRLREYFECDGIVRKPVQRNGKTE